MTEDATLGPSDRAAMRQAARQIAEQRGLKWDDLPQEARHQLKKEARAALGIVPPRKRQDAAAS